MVLVTCSGFPGRGTIIGGAMAPLAPPLSTSLNNTDWGKSDPWIISGRN